METEIETFEKDVYHLPKHFKKAGKLLLKAAAKGEFAFVKSAVGKNVIYDFDREFFYNLSTISKYLNNLHRAYTKIFSAINSQSSTDLIRSIGRLDGAIAAMVDACQIANSYEFEEEGEFLDLEKSGLLLLQDTLASLVQYAVEVEADLGKQLLDTERLANESHENLNSGKHTISVNFDSSKSIDKLNVLLEWYGRYRESITSQDEDQIDDSFVDSTPEDPIEHVASVDAAVLGYIVGSNQG